MNWLATIRKSHEWEETDLDCQRVFTVIGKRFKEEFICSEGAAPEGRNKAFLYGTAQ